MYIAVRIFFYQFPVEFVEKAKLVITMFLVIFGLILSGNVLYIAVLIIEKNKNAFKLSSISVPAIIKPVVILIGIALLMGIVKTS